MTGDGALDATHCNGVAYDPNAWIASFYCASEVVAVNAETGEPSWILGGVDGTLEQGDGATFTLSHAPSVVDGTLRLFDNGSSATGSRVAVLGATPRYREWRGPTGEYTPVLGAEAEYGDGILVSFGAARGLYWLGEDGAPKAHLEVEPGYILSSVGGVPSPVL